MASEYGSIDEVLANAQLEVKQKDNNTDSYIEEPEIDSPEIQEYESKEEPVEENSNDDDNENETSEEVIDVKPDYDDYGNEKSKPKIYTEDEVNERINKAVRDRLSRMERNVGHQNQNQNQQNNNYSPSNNEDQDWQQQLEQFVEQTFNKISQKQVIQAQQYKEQQAQAQFEEKFHQGMDKFTDFRDVVGSQPITDPMTMALRGLNDPASFLYAASKRHPDELSRISQLIDPIAQMFEMGKLEEKMRKNAPATKAPRPITHTKDDSIFNQKDDKSRKEESIEDLIAKSDAKRRSQYVARRR